MDLRGMIPDELGARVGAMGAPAYRAEQVFRWLHGPGAGGFGAIRDLEAAANVPAALRQALRAETPVRTLTLDLSRQAADGTRKFRFLTEDARAIESVLIPDDNTLRDKLTLCISSQVGCAIDCRFCATATLGFGRHLSAGEIVAQVYWATEIAGRRPTNIVFMGMGEPLHNYDNVERALTLLAHPWGAGLSPRRMTVSTAGLVTGIERLARRDPLPNLAISLNATTDDVRDQIMPINRKWPIARLLEAVRAFPLGHGRKVTFEYVLLAGVNDSLEDAHRLRRIIGKLPAMVNLIPWNAFTNGDAAVPRFQRPSTEHILAFQDAVRADGLQVFVRMPRGDDIDAACGQLAARPRAEEARLPDANLVRALRTPRAAQIS